MKAPGVFQSLGVPLGVFCAQSGEETAYAATLFTHFEQPIAMDRQFSLAFFETYSADPGFQDRRKNFQACPFREVIVRGKAGLAWSRTQRFVQF